MLDFIRDIFSSFRQASLERVKSPFLGAFVFSWIGFNWPMLAILFFSKVEIEKRISYIEGKFGLDSYLIGPLCTSALIAYLLPKINKLVTKIQDKPNIETIEMSLNSKIKIAELQQRIAEIEARKKLSEKQEERNIEEGIEKVKSELNHAKMKLANTTKAAKEAVEENTQLKGRISEEQSKYIVESDTRKKLQSELDVEKQINRKKDETLIELNSSLQTHKSNFNDLKKSLDTIKQLEEKITKTEFYLNAMMELYPEIFEIKKNEKIVALTIKDEASEYLFRKNSDIKRKREQEKEKTTPKVSFS